MTAEPNHLAGGASGYRITATLGPASVREDTWAGLIEAGATGFRLNTSHLSLAELAAWLERLQAFYAAGAPSLPVVLDLQGSKWRLGIFEPFTLLEGQVVELVLGEEARCSGVLPVPHSDFFAATAFSDGNIALDDAKIRLRVEASGESWMRALALTGGAIAPNKGITYRASSYRVETLGEKDRAILAQTIDLPFIRYAISYVKDAMEGKQFRAQVDALRPGGERRPYLIAKLERQPALEEAGAFVPWVEELWLCRGDLGAELGIPGMAAAVHRFTRRVRDIPIPVFLAGQVLEHMVASPAPTRSEVYTLYDALQHGYSGLVLSDEVAVGRYPVEACRAAAMFQPGGDNHA